MSHLPLQRPRIVFSHDPLAVLPTLQHTLERRKRGRLTLQVWQTLPGHDALLEEVITRMAALALAVWPDWYASHRTTAHRPGDTLGSSLAQEPGRQALQRACPRLSLPWLTQAVARASRGAAPLIRNLSRTVQCEQLAMALDLRDGVVLIAVTAAEQHEDNLRSLAQVCDWLAETTGAGVVVVLPPELAGHGGLDRIAYEALDLTSPTEAPSAAASRDEEIYRLWPIQGRPHPCSPGEQLLAARLATDGELAGLFTCNDWVSTVLGSRYLVDLLWSRGKLVVEVDGYRHHVTPLAFNQDRQRDYELLISGFLVLRLSHSEVMQGVDSAVAKIREIVAFRRRQQPELRGDP